MSVRPLAIPRFPDLARRRCFLVASVALAGACAENAPDPLAPSRESMQVPSSRAATSSSTGVTGLVVTRTVTYRAKTKGSKTPTRLVQTFTLNQSSDDSPAFLTWPGAPVSADSVSSFQAMTLGVVSVGAWRATVECTNGKEWRTENRLAGNTSLDVHGRDEVPFTRMDVVQDGQIVGSFKAKWRRLSDRWIMTSREFETADKSMREEIQLDHRAVLKRSSPLPEGTCAPQVSNSMFSTVAPALAQAGPRARSAVPCPTLAGGNASGETVLASLDFGDDGEDPSGASDPCRIKQLKVVQASIAVLGASAAVAAACTSIFAVVTIPACIAAGTAYGIAVTELGIARIGYSDCMEAERLRKLIASEGAGGSGGGSIASGSPSGSTLSCTNVYASTTTTWSDGTQSTETHVVGTTCHYT